MRTEPLYTMPLKALEALGEKLDDLFGRLYDEGDFERGSAVEDSALVVWAIWSQRSGIPLDTDEDDETEPQGMTSPRDLN